MYNHSDLCVGIDLGTTNSALSVIAITPGGIIRTKIIDLPRLTSYHGYGGSALADTYSSLLPSYVFYRKERSGGYTPMVGDYARKQYGLHPQFTAKSIKSQMGNQTVVGLSSDIPDKTPEAVVSRILKHMIKSASKYCKTQITDVIITVPANFDISMRNATIEAAKLAGICVANEDGTKRQILLPEPTAVLYDLINQIQQGEIPNVTFELSEHEKKLILVFDIGGGTLDITVHRIGRKPNNPEVLVLDEIATNRYTNIGGDNFDELVKEYMFSSYLKMCEKVGKRKEAESDREIVYSQLLEYAELLKIKINAKAREEDDGWGDESDKVSAGGHISTGYSYDEDFSLEDYKKIVSKLMGYELKYDDFKRFDNIPEYLKGNIIYPILDVLKKTSQKLGTNDFKIDEVVLNGGMSKFILIEERIKQFFNCEPLAVTLPDLAVARGASVYHYYMHKYSELQENLKEAEKKNIGIQTGNIVLNDDIYLALKNNIKHKLMEAGQNLPFTSDEITGFKLEPRQNEISVPIWDSRRKLASGKIKFNKTYYDGADISIKFTLSKSKLLSLEADAYVGGKLIETGSVSVLFKESSNVKDHTTLFPPHGSKLNPASEINTIEQFCENIISLSQGKGKGKSSNTKIKITTIQKQLRMTVKNIHACQNPEDFAEKVLEKLERTNNALLKHRLFVIARKLCKSWKEEERRELASHCLNAISGELNGMDAAGDESTTNIEAIQALGVCGSLLQINKLKKLHSKEKYKSAILSAYASSKTCIDFIYTELVSKMNYKKSIQTPVWAIGVAMNDNEDVDFERKHQAIVKIVLAIESCTLNIVELSNAVIALGLICDSRKNSFSAKEEDKQFCLECINKIDSLYYFDNNTNFNKTLAISRKIINGLMLNSDDEKYLLSRIENEEE